jgi:hypothetical protein
MAQRAVSALYRGSATLRGAAFTAVKDFGAGTAVFVPAGEGFDGTAKELVYCRAPICEVLDGHTTLGTLVIHYNGKDERVMDSVKEAFPDIEDKGITTRLLMLPGGKSFFMPDDEEIDMLGVTGSFLHEGLRCKNIGELPDISRRFDMGFEETRKALSSTLNVIERLKLSFASASSPTRHAAFSVRDGGVQCLALSSASFEKFVGTNLALPSLSASFPTLASRASSTLAVSDKSEEIGDFARRVLEERGDVKVKGGRE